MRSFLYQDREDVLFVNIAHFIFIVLTAPNQWSYSIEFVCVLLVAVLVNIVVSYAFEKRSALRQQGYTFCYFFM